MWGLDDVVREQVQRMHLPETPETNALVTSYLQKHYGRVIKPSELPKALALFYEFTDYRIHEDFKGICSGIAGYLENAHYWRTRE